MRFYLTVFTLVTPPIFAANIILNLIVSIALWWAGLDSNQRSREAADLQSAAIATMRPTHINGFPGIFVEAHNRKELLNLYYPFAEGRHRRSNP